MIDALQMEFMRHALLAGLLVSLVCGVIGTLVVVNRIVFLAGGIAHAAYGGIGLAIFLGWPFLAGTLGVALAAAAAMAAVTLRARHRADAVVGVIWAVGMAAGVVLIDLTPGYRSDLMSYLFGSILAVPAAELAEMAAVAALVVAVVAAGYPGFLAMSYDPEFARIRGVPVAALYVLMLALIAASVVIVIRVVGLILVIALLTIPPFIAESFSGSLRGMMVRASVLSALFTVSGLLLSYALDLTSGATIILVAAAGFGGALLWRRLFPGRPVQAG